MVVERDGRRREFRLRAAERPEDLEAYRRFEVAFEPDSMVRTMVRVMDSMRVRLVSEGGASLRVLSEPPDRSAEVTVVTTGQSSVRAPFEYFVFRGEEDDSLRNEMDELNRVMSDLRDRMAERSRELRRTSRSSQVGLTQDEVYARLQEQMETALRRSTSLQSAMADQARANAGFDYTFELEPSTERPVVAPPSRPEFRPLTPYLLGRNRVAGAEVIDLQPELAAYFGVERGVLVVDVTPRTPAAVSGVVPGDVITHLDQVVLSSVEDLRFGVSRAGDVLPMTLIRRGNSVQVLLRR